MAFVGGRFTAKFTLIIICYCVQTPTTVNFIRAVTTFIVVVTLATNVQTAAIVTLELIRRAAWREGGENMQTTGDRKVGRKT